MRFDDRAQAGRLLAGRSSWLSAGQPVVVAITAGAVPVAHELAQRLLAPLELLMVRRIRSPEDPAVTLGAAAEDGSVHLDDRAAARDGISGGTLRAMATEAALVAARRGSGLRRGRPVADLRDRSVIVVDDGAISGCSLLAAIDAVRARGAREVHVAVPSAPRPAVTALRRRADHVVCPHVPRTASAFPALYTDDDIPDDGVVAGLLTGGGAGGLVLGSADGRPPAAGDVVIAGPDGPVTGRLRLPLGATTAVVLGGSAMAELDQLLGARLAREGCVTLTLELRSDDGPEEDIDPSAFERLGRQWVGATHWLWEHLGLAAVPVAYVGEGVVAAAALRAAAREHDLHVHAIVARAGRLELVREDLPDVLAPTLLLVDEDDRAGRAEHALAEQRLAAGHALHIVPSGRDRGVPGPERWEDLAHDWLVEHLRLVHRS